MIAFYPVAVMAAMTAFFVHYAVEETRWRNWRDAVFFGVMALSCFSAGLVGLLREVA